MTLREFLDKGNLNESEYEYFGNPPEAKFSKNIEKVLELTERYNNCYLDLIEQGKRKSYAKGIHDFTEFLRNVELYEEEIHFLEKSYFPDIIHKMKKYEKELKKILPQATHDYEEYKKTHKK